MHKNLSNLSYVNLHQAIQNLNNGELVAIPTETVYGLAANININNAIQNIYKLKGRPSNHPLIVHVHKSFDVERYAKVCHIAQKLIDNFWPAPLTLVLEKTKHIPEYITGQQNTVAIRSPKHDLTQQLLAGLGYGIAAPSANRFGYISPTKASHVYTEYLNHDMNDIKLSILDGGDCDIGLESTIVYINSDNTVSILRHGMLGAEELSKIVEIKDITSNNMKDTPKVSGDLPSHYAPKTALEILTRQQLINLSRVKNTKKIFFLCFEETFNQIKFNDINNKYLYIEMLSNNPQNYAHNIYDILRRVDNICQTDNIANIYIEEVPNTIQWYAIQDRLQRASYK